MGANNPQITEVASKKTMVYFKRNARFLATDFLYASGRRVRENVFSHGTTNATLHSHLPHPTSSALSSQSSSPSQIQL